MNFQIKNCWTGAVKTLEFIGGVALLLATGAAIYVACVFAVVM